MNCIRPKPFLKIIPSLTSLSCMLQEQQSCSIPWQPRLLPEAYFPPSCHPPQTSTSSPWGSDLRPCHREADPQGPSGVTPTTLLPAVGVHVAVWQERANLSQVTAAPHCTAFRNPPRGPCITIAFKIIRVMLSTFSLFSIDCRIAHKRS